MFRAASLIAFVLFLTVNTYGQSYKEEVQKQFYEYTGLLVKKEFAKSFAYINPDFFKIFPKEQLLTVLEQTFRNPALEYELEKPTITAVDDKKSIAGSDYVTLSYTNHMKLRFKPADGKRNDTALTKKALENKFGEGKVSYDAQTDFYSVFVVKNVIANSADGKKWTFVVVEEKQKPLLEKFLPKELL